MLRLPFFRKRGGFCCAGLDLEAGRAVLVRSGSAGPEVAARAVTEPRPSPGDTAAVLLEELGAPDAPVVVDLAGEGVMVKSLRLPADIGESGIPEAVRWQFAEVLEGSSLVRHVALGQSPDGQHEVLAAAVPEALVEGKVAPLRAAGVRLLAADLRACALWRAAELLSGREGKALGAVEVSPSGARVACGRGRLEFVREIAGENLEFEVRRTLGYYQSQYGVGEVVVARFGPSGEGEDARFAVALGLALWPFAEPRVDLLPKRLRRAKAFGGRQVFRPACLVAGGVVCAALLLCPLVLGAAWKASARAASAEAARLRPTVAKVEALREEFSRLEEWTRVVSSFQAVSWASAVDDLRYALPEGCWLTKAEFAPGNPASPGQPAAQPEQPPAHPASSVGVAPGAGLPPAAQLPPEPGRLEFSGYAPDVKSVGLFCDNLAALPWVESVRVKRVERDDQWECYAFSGVADLKGGGSR